jgi:5-methylcytosine-specific restriction endonuclease McrA
MNRKPPRLGKLQPKLKAAEHRTLLPKPPTYANRIARDPTLAFYNSAEWRNLRSAIMRERGRTCQKCGQPADRPYCDHIEEIRDGGASLDPQNIQVLCASCHAFKTGRARARRFGLA